MHTERGVFFITIRNPLPHFPPIQPPFYPGSQARRLGGVRAADIRADASLRRCRRRRRPTDRPPPLPPLPRPGELPPRRSAPHPHRSVSVVSFFLPRRKCLPPSPSGLVFPPANPLLLINLSNTHRLAPPFAPSVFVRFARHSRLIMCQRVCESAGSPIPIKGFVPQCPGGCTRDGGRA